MSEVTFGKTWCHKIITVSLLTAVDSGPKNYIECALSGEGVINVTLLTVQGSLRQQVSILNVLHHS